MSGTASSRRGLRAATGLTLLVLLTGCSSAGAGPSTGPGRVGANPGAVSSPGLASDSSKLAAAATPNANQSGAYPPASAPAATPGAGQSGVSRPAGAPAFPAYAATARIAHVEVHATANGPVARTLSSPQPSGAPLTFLVDHQDGDWVQVLLPIQPNGSTGWVRASEVHLDGLPYRLDVARGQHTLSLYRFDQLLHTFPIAVGTADTPTPGGTFYLKELLAPPNPNGAYGPFAFGLSGFSTTLASFGGGDAVIGIHGTNDPTTIGHDLSHGCIRMTNPDIRSLAALLPLGTPVRILA